MACHSDSRVKKHDSHLADGYAVFSQRFEQRFPLMRNGWCNKRLGDRSSNSRQLPTDSRALFRLIGWSVCQQMPVYLMPNTHTQLPSGGSESRSSRMLSRSYCSGRRGLYGSTMTPQSAKDGVDGVSLRTFFLLKQTHGEVIPLYHSPYDSCSHWCDEQLNTS